MMFPPWLAPLASHGPFLWFEHHPLHLKLRSHSFVGLRHSYHLAMEAEEDENAGNVCGKRAERENEEASENVLCCRPYDLCGNPFSFLLQQARLDEENCNDRLQDSFPIGDKICTDVSCIGLESNSDRFLSRLVVDKRKRKRKISYGSTDHNSFRDNWNGSSKFHEIHTCDTLLKVNDGHNAVLPPSSCK